MKNTTILVTGAAGFIGFHVAKQLHEQGNTVVGLDNFNDYYSPALKKKRATMLQNLGVQVHVMDLNNKEKLTALFESQAFSHVLHLAAQAGVRYARQNPESYLRSNIDGFLNILEILKKNPAVKFVYASSSSVYGCNIKIPFSVEDVTDRPANLYAATKKANELMAYSYHHLYGIAMTGLRYFTVYGPWGRPDMAYFHFTQAMCEKRPICLYNEGKMQRDFTYIDDAVSGTIAALEHVDGFDIFNIGNNRPVELLQFVTVLEEALGIKAIKHFHPASGDEVPITYADITSAKAKLHYQPKTTIETGLKNFVTWYQTFKTSSC